MGKLTVWLPTDDRSHSVLARGLIGFSMHHPVLSTPERRQEAWLDVELRFLSEVFRVGGRASVPGQKATCASLHLHIHDE